MNQLSAFARILCGKDGYSENKCNFCFRYDLVSTVVLCPPMTRRVTRSHSPVNPIPNSQCQELEGARLSISSLGRPRWRKSMQISAHPFPIYGLADYGALKKDIQSHCVLGILVREEPLHLPRFLRRPCENRAILYAALGCHRSSSISIFHHGRSFVSIISRSPSTASCLRPVESAITVLFAGLK